MRTRDKLRRARFVVFCALLRRVDFGGASERADVAPRPSTG